VTISFPVGALIVVRDGQQNRGGRRAGAHPQESQKTRDITGGLPRVAELFEARSPKDAGMLPSHGNRVLRQGHQGKQRLIIFRPRARSTSS